MLRIALFALLMLICFPVHSSDEETLREIKTVLWPKAYRTQDVQLLDQILHPSFEMIGADGSRSSREKELDFVANNAWDPGTFEYSIERLDIYNGRVAIVAGTGNAENYSYHSSNVLIKEDGRWQAIASHVSGYQEKATEAEHQDTDHQ